MPLFLRKTEKKFDLALWEITEPISYFEPYFGSANNMANENKRRQWYASRLLVSELAGIPIEILKDKNGKPIAKHPELRLSITHTTSFAGVIMSKQHEVGIDIENLNPKVERIAHKFLREEEIAAIAAKEKIQKLILYWSAKESLYKLHGQKQLDFKGQLLIEPFQLCEKGDLKAVIKSKAIKEIPLVVHYEFFKDQVLTYVVGR